MKKTILFAIIIIAFSIAASAADMKYGSLSVFSRVKGANIYVDGKLAGENQIIVSKIQAGTHFLKITTGMGSSEKNLYAEVVVIRSGENTTLNVTEKGIEGLQPAPSAEYVDIFKAKRVLDYGKEMHTGWYLKLGSLADRYYSTDDNTPNNFTSTLGIGLGYKIALAQNVDFILEMERGQFTSSKAIWYLMPITANISISFLPSPYVRGKQYYGFGLGYYMTDLETPLKENLTALGYHLFYGVEFPMGDKNAIFLQFGYYQADMSRYDYMLNASYVSVGYRFDITE